MTLRRSWIIPLCLVTALLLPSGRQAATDTAPASPVPQVQSVSEDSSWEAPAYSTDMYRELIFYPPGKAPSAELEYDPVPFEDLLPRRSMDDGYQPVAQMNYGTE